MSHASSSKIPKISPHQYASLQHPSILAVIEGRYRFRTAEDALRRLDAIRNSFTRSRHQPETGSEQAVVLWVRGFEISPEEQEKGYSGNFAMLTYQMLEDGHATLVAHKLPSELEHHPQRVREILRHPNWGHPILRSLKKGRIYTTLAEAQAELQQLQEEYPDVAIPGDNKLFVMIYEKDQEPPVKKYILTVELADDKLSYKLHAKPNEKKPKRTLLQQPEATEGVETGESAAAAPETKTPLGYYTAKVALKKKKRPTAKKPTPKPEGE